MWKFLAFLAISCSLLSSPLRAETIAAINNASSPAAVYWGNGVSKPPVYASQADSCAAAGQTVSVVGTVMPTSGAFNNSGGKCFGGGMTSTAWNFLWCTSGSLSGQNCVISGYSCPANQGWTLSGSTCTRPDCPAGQSRDANGQCVDKCASKTGQSSLGWYGSPVGSPSLESTQYCDGGCSVGLNPSSTGTAYVNGKMRVQRYEAVQLGFSCSGGTALPGALTGPVPPEPPKNPPCADGEGVLTSSTGKVACVPSGTPSSDLPSVTKDKKTTSYPDGSQKVEEKTVTRDKQTGAEDTVIKTTVTPGAGGGTQAGTPGTTVEGQQKAATTGNDPTKPENSDFCAKNPDLQICKGGMNEEATQKKVLEAGEKVRDSLDAKDFAPDSFFTGKDVSQGVRDDVTAKMNAAKGEIEGLATGGPVSGSFDLFKSSMGDWFEPITTTGCQPFTLRVASYTWTLDHCPTAAKISEIAGYCLWVLFAFSLFNVATRDHR